MAECSNGTDGKNGKSKNKRTKYDKRPYKKKSKSRKTKKEIAKSEKRRRIIKKNNAHKVLRRKIKRAEQELLDEGVVDEIEENKEIDKVGIDRVYHILAKPKHRKRHVRVSAHLQIKSNKRDVEEHYHKYPWIPARYFKAHYSVKRIKQIIIEFLKESFKHSKYKKDMRLYRLY